jgi:hypothetical protein
MKKTHQKNKITGIIRGTRPTPLWPLHQITGKILGDLIRFFLKISSNKRKGAKLKVLPL